MSLKIKSITYNEVHIHNCNELDRLYEDIKSLVIEGFCVSMEVYATNTATDDDSELTSVSTGFFYNPAPAAKSSNKDTSAPAPSTSKAATFQV